MTLLDILAILLGLAALFGHFNHRFLQLPHTIGLVVIALFASAMVILGDRLLPELQIGETVRNVLRDIDFHDTLMEGFLSALLFAGAVHIDLTKLKQRGWAIGLMATVGVLISTFLVGTAIWLVARFASFDLPLAWAMVFGALISPTDPVAVLGILKAVRFPPLLEAKIAGESLFNDGVGVVVFTIVLAVAVSGSGGSEPLGAIDVAQLFVLEAFGGAALGLICGLIAFALLYSLDEYNIEIMITLALVTGAYALALKLHVSGPIAVVVAGLLIGNQGARLAMSDKTARHVFQFWELSDEILNSILFLLIGLEVLVITPNIEFAWFAAAAIPIVLAARWISVSVPITLLAVRQQFTPGAKQVLTWGGLRGGISVALALSLPTVAYKPPILAATYAVVVFSIVVQGLTMKPLVRAVIPAGYIEDEEDA
jgi:CPA1 family monovalent cation:H+ antiporter